MDEDMLARRLSELMYVSNSEQSLSAGRSTEEAALMAKVRLEALRAARSVIARIRREARDDL
jgi:hypothetical protein